MKPVDPHREFEPSPAYLLMALVHLLSRRKLARRVLEQQGELLEVRKP